MAEHGHAPTRGLGHRIWAIRQRRCPNCRPEGEKIEAAPELEPGGDSSLVCPDCDAAFRIGGVP